MKPITPEEQSKQDLAEAKIRLIENGYMVRTGGKWFIFQTWDLASAHLHDHFAHSKAQS